MFQHASLLNAGTPAGVSSTPEDAASGSPARSTRSRSQQSSPSPHTAAPSPNPNPSAPSSGNAATPVRVSTPPGDDTITPPAMNTRSRHPQHKVFMGMGGSRKWHRKGARQRPVREPHSSANSQGGRASADDDGILLTFDGEWGQVEAIFRYIMAQYEGANVEFLKFPGGCSLLFQPCDLMIAYRIIRAYIQSPGYAQAVLQKKTMPTPAWLPQLLEVLKLIKMDKASRECYENLFRQLVPILSKAFDAGTILGGWAVSGLEPFNLEVMMRKFPKWRNFTQEEQVGVFAAVADLSIESSTSGVCEDADMVAAVKQKEGCSELADTMDVISQKAIIRMRTVRFGGERVMELRKEEVAARAARAARSEATALASRARVAGGARETAGAKKKRRTQEFNDGTLTSQPFATPSHFPLLCSNDLCNSKLSSTTDSSVGWRQCRCGRAFCSGRICATKIKNHIINCDLA
jgi:hypothetical protein